MQLGKTVPFNSFKWVKEELRQLLQEVQRQLEVYVESNEKSTLDDIITVLNQVRGTLEMLEAYGAALLAEEMQAVVEALRDDRIPNRENAFEVLFSASIKLPDYIESLAAGNKDVPLVLLPLLNDLRACRNISLLSENVLFFPDVTGNDRDTDAEPTIQVDPSQLARKLRHIYQLGLLGWFRNRDTVIALQNMQEALIQLFESAQQVSARRLWRVALAITESLQHVGIESSVALKSLMGKVDRQIKQLATQTETEFVATLDDQLTKNLLYYIARSRPVTERVQTIQDEYQLANYLPDDAELTQAQRWLSGPNQELLNRVTVAIKEDIQQAKDALDAFVHNPEPELTSLSILPELLTKNADTLGMLSFGHARDRILHEKLLWETTLHNKVIPDEEQLMKSAAVLLDIEQELDDHVARRLDMFSDDAERLSATATDPKVIAENQRVIVGLVNEALKNIALVKDAFLNYIETPGKPDVIRLVPDLLRELAGAMFVKPLDEIKSVIDGLKNYFADHLLQAQQKPEAKEQDALADVIANIECFLEAVAENRAESKMYVAVAKEALQRLQTLASESVTLDALEANLQTLAADLEPAAESASINQVDELVIDDNDLAAVDQTEAMTDPGTVLDTLSAQITSEQAAFAIAEHPEQLQIVGDDTEEDIIQIFIEEAIEELQRINTILPVWHNNPGDHEAITTIRRSFHTLKGSGRLIGAMLIGEFAWSIEHMLNRLIEGAIQESPALFAVVEEALTILPQLIEQIRGYSDPVDNVFELMQRATEVAAQTAVSDADETGAEEIQAHLDRIAVAEAEQESANTVAIPEIESVAPQADLTDASESAIVTVLPDIIAEQETLESNAQPSSDTPEQPLSAEPESSVAELTASGLNEQRFAAESTDMANAEAEAEPQDSIETVEKTVVLEQTEVEISNADDEPSTATNIKFVEPEVDSTLTVGAVAELHPSATEATTTAVVETESSGSTAAYLSLNIDPALLDIFSDEADAHLAEIERISDKARQGTMSSKNIEALIRALHTLHGSARTANLQSIAEKAKKLEVHANNLAELDEPWLIEELDLLDRSVAYVRAYIGGLHNDDSEPQDDQQLMVGLTQCLERSEAAMERLRQERTQQFQALDAAELDFDLVSIFLEEAPDITNIIEQQMHAWKDSDFQQEQHINEIMRQLHTLKGAARMADLPDIGDLCHILESLYTAINIGELPVSDNLVDHLTKSIDKLYTMLDLLAQGRSATITKEYLQRLENLRAIEHTPTAEAVEEPPITETVELSPQAIDIELAQPITPPASDSIVATTEDAEPVTALAQPDYIRVRSDKLDNLVNYSGEVNIHQSRLGQHINDISFNLGELGQTIVRLNRQLRDMEIQTEAQIQWRLEREAENPYEEFDPLEMDRYSHMQQLSRSMAESASDLDNLKDSLNELAHNSEFVLQLQSRLGTELQEELLESRMIRFTGLTSRLRRVVRQTADRLDKKVELQIIGAENEIDRSVQERMLAPLEHMLRNAVYHGIEPPRVRTAAGKAETGSIYLNIDREGSYIVLQVVDDGYGIDVARVRQKALQLGLLTAGEHMTDDEVMQLVLHEGFSTVENISQIAGRGVGMNVVDSEIKRLGGNLEIHSEPGAGTTFTVRLPLTLAVNQALLVQIDADVYAIPLSIIEGVESLSTNAIQENMRGERMHYEYLDNSYEMKYLGSLLGVEFPHAQRLPEQRYPLLLMRSGQQRVCVHVDAMLGRREIVVKPVGPQITAVPGISGATILADGRVALILDERGLFRSDAPELTTKINQTAATKQLSTRQQRTIMVVDDSITIRKVTARILDRNQLRVVTAKDGLDAVQQLQDVTPDLFLLDIEMPRMDGFEFASHVRADERLHAIPIIMITSRTGDKHRERAEKIGVERYLGKPFQETELIYEINELLDRSVTA